MADRPAKCSSCDVPAQVILEDNIPQKVVCPRCGMSESYGEFQRSVGHQASAYASKELGKAFSPDLPGWPLPGHSLTPQTDRGGAAVHGRAPRFDCLRH